MGNALGGAFGLVLSFFPPVLTPSYVWALVGLVIETLGLSLGAMTIAFAVSLPLSLFAGLRLKGSKTLLATLTAFRAIPDLTLAILCVILFGVGTGAGLVALTLYYTAAVTKAPARGALGGRRLASPGGAVRTFAPETGGPPHLRRL
jgi:phosphonate transport system permease protein